DVGCVARPACVHHVERVLTDPTRHNRTNWNARLDDGVQSVLPVAHPSLIVELDGFASQPPLATLDGGGHGLDAASRNLTVRSTTVEPFPGQFRRNGRDLEVQARPGRECRVLPGGLA